MWNYSNQMKKLFSKIPNFLVHDNVWVIYGSSSESDDDSDSDRSSSASSFCSFLSKTLVGFEEFRN